MKVVRLHEYGDPEVLTLEEVPTPEPAPSEVLIKVMAVGVNYADTMRRRNEYLEPSPLPFTPEIEVAGTVEALGEGVTSPSVGASVFAVSGVGGYAQYITLPAAQVIPIPPQLDAVKAAAIFLQGMTAFLVLKQAGRLQSGETVLVQAAAGGVGIFAVQLAKHWGARVLAAASTPKKLELARSLGADVTIDYTQSDWAERVQAATDGEGVDLILEMVGGDVFEQSLNCLAPFGRMVVYGLASGRSVAIEPQRLLAANQSIVGFYIGKYFSQPDLIQTSLGELMEAITSERLKLQISAVLPLSQAAEVHRLLESRQTIGKVVLQPWANL